MYYFFCWKSSMFRTTLCEVWESNPTNFLSYNIPYQSTPHTAKYNAKIHKPKLLKGNWAVKFKFCVVHACNKIYMQGNAAIKAAARHLLPSLEMIQFRKQRHWMSAAKITAALVNNCVDVGFERHNPVLLAKNSITRNWLRYTTMDAVNWANVFS